MRVLSEREERVHSQRCRSLGHVSRARKGSVLMPYWYRLTRRTQSSTRPGEPRAARQQHSRRPSSAALSLAAMPRSTSGGSAPSTGPSVEVAGCGPGRACPGRGGGVASTAASSRGGDARSARPPPAIASRRRADRLFRDDDRAALVLWDADDDPVAAAPPSSSSSSETSAVYETSLVAVASSSPSLEGSRRPRSSAAEQLFGASSFLRV
mmetsp:Transcript_20392/g.81558  ORF Transcript_20392/g.81558 Transcript_20392/m.81558 type:complete len:210 (-) Transcript_20392:346-975(-)